MSILSRLNKRLKQHAVITADVKTSSEAVARIYKDWKWSLRTKDYTKDSLIESLRDCIKRVDAEVKNGGIALSAKTAFLQMINMLQTGQMSARELLADAEGSPEVGSAPTADAQTSGSAAAGPSTTARDPSPVIPVADIPAGTDAPAAAPESQAPPAP